MEEGLCAFYCARQRKRRLKDFVCDGMRQKGRVMKQKAWSVGMKLKAWDGTGMKWTKKEDT